MQYYAEKKFLPYEWCRLGVRSRNLYEYSRITAGDNEMEYFKIYIV